MTPTPAPPATPTPAQDATPTAADIRDNKITKKFTVKNNCEDDIKIKVEFQVNHEKSEKGKFTWTGPHSSTYMLIPAGES